MSYGYYIYFALYSFYVLVGLALLYFRRNHEPIKSRTAILIVPSSLYGIFCTGLLSYFQESLGSGDYSFTAICQASSWNSIIFLPMWLLPQFLRGVVLYNQYQWNQEKLHALHAFSERSRSHSNTPLGSHHDHNLSSNGSPPTGGGGGGSATGTGTGAGAGGGSTTGTGAGGGGLTPGAAAGAGGGGGAGTGSSNGNMPGTNTGSQLSNSKPAPPFFRRTPMDELTFKQRRRQLLRYKLLTSARFNLIFFLSVMAINIAIGAALLYLNPIPLSEVSAPTGCLRWVYYQVMVQAAVIVICLIVTSVKLWHVEDGYCIKQEFVVYSVGLVIFIIIYLTVSLVKKITSAANPVIFACVFILHTFSVFFPFILSYTKRYQVAPAPRDEEMASTGSSSTGKPSLQRERSKRGKTEEKKRTPAELVQMDNHSLFKLIFRDQELFISFANFAANLWCVENVLFYQAVERYERLHEGGNTPNSIKECAIRMRDLFFDPNSLQEINIDHVSKTKILDRIGKGDFTSDLFRSSKDQISRMLEYDVLPKWKQSLESEGFAGSNRKKTTKEREVKDSKPPRVSSEELEEIQIDKANVNPNLDVLYDELMQK